MYTLYTFIDPVVCIAKAFTLCSPFVIIPPEQRPNYSRPADIRGFDHRPTQAQIQPVAAVMTYI